MDTGIKPPPPQPEGSIGRTTASEIAERIARESKEAVPGGPKASTAIPTGPVKVQEPGALVDAWGRAFDPVLHLTKLDGTTPAPRNGLLICRQGKSLAGPRAPKKAATTQATGSVEDQHRIALESLGGDAPTGEAGQAQDTAPPVIGPSPEEFKRRAQSAAKAARKAMGKLGRWLGGEEGEFKEIDGVHEGQDIEDTTLDAQVDYQKLLPIGSLTMAFLAYSTYAVRAWKSKTNQERMDIWEAKLSGRPVPKKEKKPDAPKGDGQDQVETRPATTSDGLGTVDMPTATRDLHLFQ